MPSAARNQIVIFDIDGTLADISARQHHIARTPKNWDAFFKRMQEDKLIQPIADLCNVMYCTTPASTSACARAGPSGTAPIPRTGCAVTASATTICACAQTAIAAAMSL